MASNGNLRLLHDAAEIKSNNRKMSYTEEGLERCALCKRGIQRDEPRTIFHSIQAYLHKTTEFEETGSSVPCYKLLTNVQFHGQPWDPNTCPGNDTASGKLPIHNRCQAVIRRAAKRAGVTPPGAPNKKRARQQSNKSAGNSSQKATKKNRAPAHPISPLDMLKTMNEQLQQIRANKAQVKEADYDTQQKTFEMLREVRETCDSLLQECAPVEYNSSQSFQFPPSFYPSVSCPSSQIGSIPGVSYSCNLPGVSFGGGSVYSNADSHVQQSTFPQVEPDCTANAPVPEIAGAPVPAPVGLKEAVDDATEGSDGGDEEKQENSRQNYGKDSENFGCEGEPSASVFGNPNRQQSRLQRLGSFGSGMSFHSLNQGQEYSNANMYNGSPTAFQNNNFHGSRDDKSMVSWGGESWLTNDNYQPTLLTKACG